MTSGSDSETNAIHTITPQPQTSTVQRKIGMNKGKPRLWIEGKALMLAGLDHGTRWDLVPGEGVLHITAHPEGKRKVAGSPDRPVIDISAASLDCLRDTSGNMPATVTISFMEGGRIMEVVADWLASSLDIAA